MEKMSQKVINLVGNGYGINQTMEKLELTKKDITALMEEDEELCKKLKKRFAGTDWIDAIVYKGKTVELSDGDTPEMAALKAEAVELGIEFNPRIGYDKLKERVDAYKATIAENPPLDGE